MTEFSPAYMVRHIALQNCSLNKTAPHFALNSAPVILPILFCINKEKFKNPGDKKIKTRKLKEWNKMKQKQNLKETS
jgi:hypothetical protein